MYISFHLIQCLKRQYRPLLFIQPRLSTGFLELLERAEHYILKRLLAWSTKDIDLFGEMSVVTIQLGQCGNQIGFDLFKLIAFDASLTSRKSGLLPTSNDAYQDEVVERFFEESDNKKQKTYLTARAVLVDTEPKVINQCILRSEKHGMIFSFPFFKPHRNSAS